MGMISKECAVAAGKLARQVQRLVPMSSLTQLVVPLAPAVHHSPEPHQQPGCLPDSLHGPVQVPAEASSKNQKTMKLHRLGIGSLQTKVPQPVSFHLV